MSSTRTTRTFTDGRQQAMNDPDRDNPFFKMGQAMFDQMDESEQLRRRVVELEAALAHSREQVRELCGAVEDLTVTEHTPHGIKTDIEHVRKLAAALTPTPQERKEK